MIKVFMSEVAGSIIMGYEMPLLALCTLNHRIGICLRGA